MIAPAPGRRVPGDRPGRGRPHPAARRALRARRRGRDRRARSRSGCASARRATSRSSTADALAADLRALVPPGGRLVGNLPYYVSSPLLRRFLDLRGHVRDLHVMLQDEVARRVASPPGSKEYGILSVLYALWADADVPARFPPGAFVPPPKVDSAAAARPVPGRAARPTSATWGPSSASCRGPSPAAEEPLKTTSKIAILTSRNT